MSAIGFNRHLFEMSEKYVKMEKIRQLKAKIAKNEKTISRLNLVGNRVSRTSSETGFKYFSRVNGTQK